MKSLLHYKEIRAEIVRLSNQYSEFVDRQSFKKAEEIRKMVKLLGSDVNAEDEDD